MALAKEAVLCAMTWHSSHRAVHDVSAVLSKRILWRLRGSKKASRQGWSEVEAMVWVEQDIILGVCQAAALQRMHFCLGS